MQAEIARASSEGQEAWVVARAASDFKSFAPYLERILELTRRYVDCHVGHDRFDCAYDVLIDDYEPGISTARVADLFSELKGELVPMIATLTRATPIDDSPLSARFATDGQRTLAREVVGLMGFDESGWRIDDTVHPFAVGIGPGDVRITTRWDEAYWPMSLYGAMHECGHGLYEAQIAPELRRYPDRRAAIAGRARVAKPACGRTWSAGAARSARCWRRGSPSWRVAIWRGSTPTVMFRAINRVKPTYIRVEADEATYGLHIILRFELEQDLIEGRLSIADLPEAWNARFQDYLGIAVTDDADGVLQDVHWSAGMIGYFPTYALGNLIAGQLWEAAQAEIAGLDDQLAAGQLAELREWLRRRVHRHGAKFGTEELLEREGGGPISVAPFVRYLKAKLSDVYGVDLGD